MKALKKGDYIKHFQYGLGVVTASNDECTDIDFDLHGGLETFPGGVLPDCFRPFTTYPRKCDSPVG
jgi:hypothetical protein